MQESEEGKSYYRGRSQQSRDDIVEKSADVIVVGRNEP